LFAFRSDWLMTSRGWVLELDIIEKRRCPISAKEPMMNKTTLFYSIGKRNQMGVLLGIFACRAFCYVWDIPIIPCYYLPF
ncbi:hypothetical protein D0469_20020, partial [Peribacillus saganii]